MEQTAAYLKNLDISVLTTNKPALSRVHSQIKPYITGLSTSKTTSDKIKEILEICDEKQLLELTREIKIENLVFHNLGSKVLEVFVKEGTYKFLRSYVRTNLKRCLNDDCATFIVRGMIEKGYQVIITPDDIDFEKECVLNTIIVYLRSSNTLKNSKDIIEKRKVTKDSREMSNHSCSLAEEIGRAKQSIIKHVLQTLFTHEKLTEMKYSFFLENFVQIMGKKEIKVIYKKIKNELQLLAVNKYSNYMIQSFIEKYEDTIQIVNSLDLAPLHENIIIKILLKLQSQKNDKMVEKVIKKYYKDIKSFLFVNDCVNIRCLKVAKRLFIIREHNMNINEIFYESFSKASFKGDIKIVRYYLMGNEETTKKNLFVRKMMSECWGKKGEEMLVWMSRCCDYETRKKILKQLRRRKKINTNRTD